MIRLMEVLLHGGTTIGGWTAKQILTAFQLSAARYGLNQLRYDLRKMKAHGLIERDGKRYAYRLTPREPRSPSPLCFSTSAYAVRDIIQLLEAA
jgi:repressor of nif and glnA expression